MRKSIIGMTAVLLSTITMPAFAQEEAESAFSVTGGAALVSDYRFRGLSQSNEEAAVQGWATVSHESGFYVGFWGSSIGFGGGTEVDFLAGYATEVAPGVTVDGGVTYYGYPGASGLDVGEGYLAVSGAVGPVNAKVGVAYAPDQSNTSGDNIYFYTDLSTAIPGTPLTLKGHYGYNDGPLGGPAGNNYADYLIGLDASVSNFTLGIAYVNTQGYGSRLVRENVGADGKVLFTLTAAF